MEKTILITGTSRGLGLAFTEKYLGKGYLVFAGARKPEESKGLLELQEAHSDHLHLLKMDVISESDVEATARFVEEKAGHVDILINNAGRYGQIPEVRAADLDYDEIRSTFETNVLAPLRVSRFFCDLLKKGNKKKLIHITSLMGSIQDNSSGGSYAYRMSKAALNMLNKDLALEFAKDEIISVALHPGWVKTDMGGPEAPMDINTSVTRMVNVIERVTINDSGTFLNYDGNLLPY